MASFLTRRATLGPSISLIWTHQNHPLGTKLQDMKHESVPLKENHLGVAARQMAVATANNIDKLNRNARNKLLQSIATFDTSEQGTS